MEIKFKEIFILADIEGSSGCFDYGATSSNKLDWARACIEMSKDIDAVVRGLFSAGIDRIIVKDFHGSGFNLIKDLIDPRVKIMYGYKKGPVIGIGEPDMQNAGLFLIGMHAASGTNGFLPHTLTSRITSIEMNNKPLPEVILFSSSLAPYNITPIFLSGCPEACRQAKDAISTLNVFPIDKSAGNNCFDRIEWRKNLVFAAVQSLNNSGKPYLPEKPYNVVLTMKGGKKAAAKVGMRWKLSWEGDKIMLREESIKATYYKLVCIAYLSPLIEKILPFALIISNLTGYLKLKCVKLKFDIR